MTPPLYVGSLRSTRGAAKGSYNRLLRKRGRRSYSAAEISPAMRRLYRSRRRGSESESMVVGRVAMLVGTVAAVARGAIDMG